MPWNLNGRMIEVCSCKMFCPCVLGPAEPDRGWCSGVLNFDIERGSADGVDVGGCKATMAFDMPGDFASGNITARLYIDENASSDQRRELEAIFQGKKGGNWEALGAAFSTWLSTQSVKIAMQWGDNPTVQVGSVGKVTLAPIKDDAGRPAQMVNAPLMAPFTQTEDLARSDGSAWSDPDMRQWEAGGSGGTGQFSWSA